MKIQHLKREESEKPTRSCEIEVIKKIQRSLSESGTADRRVTPSVDDDKELNFVFLLLVPFTLH